MRLDGNILENIVSQFHPLAWILAIFFSIVQMLLLSMRWKMLINVGKKHLNFQDAVEINLISQLANLVFITSVGGILARIVLSIRHGITVFKTIIATLFDRVMTLAALVILSAAFLPGLAPYVDNKTFANLSGYISVFIITAFVFAPVFVSILIKKIPIGVKKKTKIRYGLRYLKVFMNNPMLFAKVILVSMLGQISFFVSVFALCAMGGLNLSFSQLMTVLPIISLISALPISIGGWGVREGAFVYGLGILGIPMATSFLISIQVGLIGMLSILLAGLPSLMASNISMSNISSWREQYAKIRF